MITASRFTKSILTAVTLLIAKPLLAGVDDDQMSCRYLALDDAVAACTRAIASGKFRGRDLAELYNCRGAEHARMTGHFLYREQREENTAKALADYGEAIRFGPQIPSYYYNRGLLYSESKKEYDRAIADFDEAIRLGPRGKVEGTDYVTRQGDRQKAEFFAARGGAYLKKGDIDRAIADYNEAIRIDPKFAQAYYDRGNVYRAKGDIERATADSDRAIQLDPEVRRR
jgi:tetratricopeptide (TPR) repeat protein